jgi:hypothetical protein
LSEQTLDSVLSTVEALKAVRRSLTFPITYSSLYRSLLSTASNGNESNEIRNSYRSFRNRKSLAVGYKCNLPVSSWIIHFVSLHAFNIYFTHLIYHPYSYCPTLIHSTSTLAFHHDVPSAHKMVPLDPTFLAPPLREYVICYGW